MTQSIRNIPINPALPAGRLRELIRRVETVRQGAIAEAWLTANTAIRSEEADELGQELTRKIREAFRREIEEYHGT